MYRYILPHLFPLQEYSGCRWIPIVRDAIKTKDRAIDSLHLKRGDDVLVYCIGSGYELDAIEEKIGEDGSVVGVDLSGDMLRYALKKVDENGWKNVRLVQADVTKYDPVDDIGYKVDATLCNFGLGMEGNEDALNNMFEAVKTGGRIAISGPQPLRGIRKMFYPITFIPEMVFGLTWKSLHRYPLYREIFEKELDNVSVNEDSFAKYFFTITGTKR